MKRKAILIIPLVCLLLASCGRSKETASVESQILTSVAQTLTVQAEINTPIPPTPSETPTPNLMLTPSPMETFVPTSTVNACDKSVFTYHETIEDGTVFEPNTKFTKTWEFQNTGTCAWTEKYKIIFIDGTAMQGVATELGQTVEPDGTFQVSVEMVSPSVPGSYTGYWALANNYGTFFGQIVNVTITVAGSTTPTVSASQTASPESTTATTESATATP
jgi:hypothetical protein